MPFGLGRHFACDQQVSRTLLDVQSSCSQLRLYSAAEEEDDGLPKDYKLRSLQLPTRRVDRVLKRTSNLSSSALEKAFLQSHVRVNEEVVKKKHRFVDEDDEIELWLNPYAENIDLAEVHKVKVKSYTMTDNGYQIEVKTWRSVIVPNWKRN
ncbi:Protein C47B2 protein.9 [Aphelenchoides avenae]|nr:Protein C47B2 protein.9 [Aphelenchus avenae]